MEMTISQNNDSVCGYVALSIPSVEYGYKTARLYQCFDVSSSDSGTAVS